MYKNKQREPRQDFEVAIWIPHEYIGQHLIQFYQKTENIQFIALKAIKILDQIKNSIWFSLKCQKFENQTEWLFHYTYFDKTLSN